MTDDERMALLKFNCEDAKSSYFSRRAFNTWSGIHNSGLLSGLRQRIDALSSEIEVLRVKMLDPEELRFEQEAFRRVQKARKFEERERMRRLPSLAAALEKIRVHFGGGSGR